MYDISIHMEYLSGIVGRTSPPNARNAKVPAGKT